MASLTETAVVEASLAEVWQLYFEPRTWPAWVEGFSSVEESHGYPEEGGTLIWRSIPAGRGRVSEKVLEHQPRRRHRIEFSDPESSGELLTLFEVAGEGTRVTLELTYALPGSGPLTWLTERVFVRAQVRRSLQRTLARFGREVAELADAQPEPDR